MFKAEDRSRFIRAIGLSLSMGLGLGWTGADSGADTFVEDFTTKTFCDTLHTTALWDTEAGKLTLHPFELELVGGVEVPGQVRDVALAGDHAYLAVEDGGFQVINIRDPENPVRAGGIQGIDSPLGLAVDGDHAYLAALSRLVVIDVSAPSQPLVIATVDGLSEATGIEVAGDYAYVASGNAGLITVDISTPIAPSVVGGVDTPGYASSVTLYGDYAYVTDGYFGIAVIDVSDPRAPVHLNQLPASYHPERIDVAGRLAFVAEISAELLIYSLLDPAAPRLIGTCTLAGHAQDVAVDGVHAYVAVADNHRTGLYVVDVSDPTAPMVTADMIPPGFPLGVITRGEYAFVNCLYAGLQVVRVADVIEPVEAHSLLDGATVRDLVVEGNLACLLSWQSLRSHFHAVSLSDPTRLETIGSLPFHDDAYRFVLDGPYAFVTAGDRGLTVLDIRDPATPTVVTELEIAGSALYIAQAGDYAYLGVLGTMHSHLIVVDITDPQDPVQVAEIDCATTPHGMARSGNFLFISEHEDGALRYGTDLETIDISDPLNPTPAGSYFMESVFAQDLRVEGDVLYASFWDPLGSSGVQLLDITNPLGIQALGCHIITEGFGSEVCLAGDVAYVAGGTRRLDVLDVSDPSVPTLLHSVPTTFAVRCLDRAGDFLFCGADWGGLNSLHAFDRGVNQVANAAQSLPLPTSGDDLAMIRLDAIQQPTMAWEISADGGQHWQGVPGDGSWCQLEHPGPELLWRAALLYSQPGDPPSVDQLELTWTYGPSAAPPGTIVRRLVLHQNVPNPFNPVTTIRLELPELSHVTLEIIDVGGRVVATPIHGTLAAGSHDVEWRGLDPAGHRVSSGIYLYRLTTPGCRQTRKMLLLE